MTKTATVALVGSETLLGREVRDLAANQGAFALRLLAADHEQAGTLARVGDEPAIMEELKAESFEGAQVVVLAGPAESGKRGLELAEQAGIAVVDLTGLAEDFPDARLRAPLVEEQQPEADCRIHVIAHPAAIALALFLRRLHAHEPVGARWRRSSLRPANTAGKGWKNCSSRPSTCCRSNRCRKRFSMRRPVSICWPATGRSAASLEEAELRIERHLATLLALPGDGEGVPLPSLRLVQAPVFHGYSMSVWVEFEAHPGVEALESSLSSPEIDVRGSGFRTAHQRWPGGPRRYRGGGDCARPQQLRGLLVLAGGGQLAA